MTKDTVVAFRAPERFSPDPLTDLLRQGARQLIAQAGRDRGGRISRCPCRPDRRRWPQAVAPARSPARAGGSNRHRCGAGEGAPGA